MTILSPERQCCLPLSGSAVHKAWILQNVCACLQASLQKHALHIIPQNKDWAVFFTAWSLFCFLWNLLYSLYIKLYHLYIDIVILNSYNKGML